MNHRSQQERDRTLFLHLQQSIFEKKNFKNCQKKKQ